jgi:hypothetical protein
VQREAVRYIAQSLIDLPGSLAVFRKSIYRAGGIVTHRVLRSLFVLLFVGLFGSTGFGQQFSIALQFSSSTPKLFSAFNGRAQFEVTYDALEGLTLGGKLTLDNTPLVGQFIFWVNPNALYRFHIYDDGQVGLTGYGGASLFGSYSPNQPVQTPTKPKEVEIEDDDDGDPHPGGNPTAPTQTFGVEGLLLSGLDVAYIIDDLTTLYGGLEFDLRLFPKFQPAVYPYLEIDYVAIDSLTLALGGYVSWSPGVIGYSIYTNAFYDVASDVGLRFEVGFDGNLYTYLRLTYRF